MRVIKKAKTLRDYNPDTCQYEWRNVEVKRQVHDEDDRTMAVLDFFKRELSVEELLEKHHISSAQVLYSWIGRYLSENTMLSLQENTPEDMAGKSKDEQIRELRAKLKKACKDAEYERLRAHAFDTMINLAERTFNIPIRKKSGTKQ